MEGQPPPTLAPPPPARAGRPPPDPCLLRARFRRPPAEAGWQYEPPADGRGDGAWEPSSPAGEEGGFLTATAGLWTSPPFPLAPFDYAELRFAAHAEGPAFWVANFHTVDGTRLIADHYSGLDAGATWAEHRSCFRARPGTAAVRVSFQPANGRRLRVREVAVRRLSRAEAAAWAEAVAATAPPVPYAPPPDRWRRLPRTLEALRAGRALTVVLLGDSAMNDLANSAFDVRVERHYPGARLNLIPSVNGSVGGLYYREEGRVGPNVLAHRPDLLLLGGISGALRRSPEEGVEGWRDVIRQVRAAQSPELLLLTGAVGRADPRATPGWAPEPGPDGTDYRGRLRRLAEEVGAAFLDLEGAWGSYLLSTDRPRDFFIRDACHANDRGRQVLATILERFLAPE